MLTCWPIQNALDPPEIRNLNGSSLKERDPNIDPKIIIARIIRIPKKVSLILGNSQIDLSRLLKPSYRKPKP